ncbi:hypothetical protein [Streptomyces canarius]|uniref:hypothetical protein n=1 Tax=Streptomyces canarius TaxID=285453 RepID=UPI00167BD53E|nr:hypothetical protein [Streptomyces canarius]
MVIVACLLLPFVGLLLYGMDRVEDWLTRSPEPPCHAGARRLRLIAGGRQEPATRSGPGRRPSHAA